MTARLARRADRGQAVLVAARDLAGDPRLPLLHDHRPEDDAAKLCWTPSRTRSASGLLATLLIAPQTTEFATKVADPRRRSRSSARRRGLVELAGPVRMSALRTRLAAAYPSRWPRPVRLVPRSSPRSRSAPSSFAAGIPARPGTDEATCGRRNEPASRDRGHRTGTTSPLSTRRRPQTIARESSSRSPRRSRLRCSARTRSSRRPPPVGRGSRRCGLQMRAPSARTTVAQYDVERMVMSLKRGTYQGPPTVVANLQGTLIASTYGAGTDVREPRGPAALPANRRARARERPVS